MSLTYTQALDQLDLLRGSGTLNASTLRELVSSLSIEASGTVSVFYSGDVNGQKTSDIAKLLTQDPTVRVLDKTDAARFLDINTNIPFRQALIDVFKSDPGLPGTTANSFLFGTTDSATGIRTPNGAWDNISGRFVDATQGPVKILTENPRDFSVFKQTELPKLIAKLQSSGDITEVSGVSRAKLLEAATTGELAKVIENTAKMETILSKAGPGNMSTFLSFTEEARVAARGLATAAENERIAKSIVALSAATSKTLVRLGPWVAIVAGAAVALQAGDAYAQGKTDEAKHLLQDFAAELAGSTAGQAAAGALAAAGLVLAGVALTTPIGMATVLIAAVAGGYFGGEWSKEVAFLFQDRTEAQARDVAERMLKLIFGENYDLNSAIPSELRSKALSIDSTFSRDEMVSAAKTDIAWRYALRELNPFVITGDSLYTIHNADGSLDLYDPLTGKGTMTDLYLQDRAAMLTWKLRYDKEKVPYTSQYNTSEIAGNWDFVDTTSKLTLAIDGLGVSLYDHQIVFGSKNDDTIDGSGDSDHLYGMAGKDTIKGDKGNDYLEGGLGDDSLTGGKGNDTLLGGKGLDTYIFKSGDGWDWIEDQDGQGAIYYDDIQLTGGTPITGTANVWKQEGNGQTFWYILTDWTENGETFKRLSIQGQNGGFFVKAWATGQLGIDLPGAPAENPAPAVIVGTTGSEKLIAQSNETVIAGKGGSDLLQAGTVASSLYADDVITLAQVVADTANLTGGGTLVAGQTQNGSALLGSANGDTLVGGIGNDVLSGGAGRDYLIGGGGADLLLGDGTMTPKQAEDGTYVGWTLSNTNGVFGIVGAGSTEAGYGDTDVLHGGGGNDMAWGGQGDDLIYGEAGDDWLVGASGSDMIDGGDGNDILVGEADGYTGPAGNDVLNGGKGNDALYGYLGNDQLTGGDDNDYLVGDVPVVDGVPANDGSQDGQDFLDGGSGNDTLYGGGNDDELKGGSGNDELYGDSDAISEMYHGKDLLDGGDGDDILVGGGADDKLIGGTGNDQLHGDGALLSNFGNDYLDGGAGDDYLRGYAGNDTLQGGAGIDEMLGEEGDDFLAGGSDNDYLYGGDGNDYLAGDAGNDQLSGGNGNDVLDGGSGIDTIAGGAGNDDYRNLEAGDVVLDREGTNTFRLNASAATLRLDANRTGVELVLENGVVGLVDALFGTAGTVMFNGGESKDFRKWANESIKTSVTLQLDDSGGAIYGAGGADTLYGGNGSDVLLGGYGSDVLRGGAGSDIYEYGVGDGNDRIVETGGSADILRFHSGIGPSDVSITRWSSSSPSEDSLRLVIASSLGGGYVNIENYFRSVDDSGRVERIEFSDGTVWDYDYVRNTLMQPTAKNDLLNGFAGNDTLDGFAGDDSISGKAGDDVLRGGDGNDKIQGSLGNDFLDGGAGNDALYGYGNWLDDAAGTADEIGNDTLRGGAGDDVMFGGQGNDTYLHDRGDGKDWITEVPTKLKASNDILRLGTGILPQNVSLYRTQAFSSLVGDLTIVIDGTSEQIVINGFFESSDQQIEYIEFNGGAGPVWSASDILAAVQVGTQNTQTGTAGNDTFTVDHESDVIVEQSNGGVDTVIASHSYTLPTNVENLTLTGVLNSSATGNALDNILVGNANDNYLDGAGGVDKASGGAGNDQYINVEQIIENPGEGIDTWISINGGTLPDNVENLYLSDGRTTRSYSVTGIGNTLDNIIASGGDGDTLDGKAGADTYLVNHNNVTVYVDSTGDVISGHAKTVVSSVDFSLGDSGDNLVLIGNATSTGTGNNGTNRLDGSQNTSANQLIGGKGNDYYLLGAGDFASELPDEGTDTAEFGFSGAVNFQMDGSNIEKVVLGTATTGTVTGSQFADQIVASGSAWLLGQGGDDTLQGGANSRLEGGDGDDRLIAYSATMVGGKGNDVYVLSNGLNVLVESPDEGIDRIETSWSYDLADNFENLTFTGSSSVWGNGNSLDNVLIGNDAYNYLKGYGGNDILDGNGGADELEGGAGNDEIRAGFGSNTIYFSQGDGNDLVVADVDGNMSARSNTLRFKGSIAPSLVQVERIDTNLILRIRGSTDSVTIQKYFEGENPGNSLNPLQFVAFSDGTTWNTTTLSLLANNHAPTGNVNVSGAAVQHGVLTAVHNLADSDGMGEVSWQWQMSSDGLNWTSIQGANANSLSLEQAQVGNYVRVAATYIDGAGTTESVISTGTALVADVNDAPRINNAPTNQTATEGNSFSYSLPVGMFGDDDPGDRLTISAVLSDGSALPGWLTFNASTLTFNGTPGPNDIATLSVKLVATDQGGLSIDGTFIIGVVPHSPVNVVGTVGNDTLFGYSGADTLNGGAGADALVGRGGNDTYVVDNVGDVVTEALNEGVDLVQSSVTYTLANNVENLTLTGTTAINGTGNSLNNVLTGNSAANTLTGGAGNDTLDGGAGNDTMVGGLGDDSYVVDSASDVVTENTSEGTDTVRSSVTLTLANNVENLVLTGATAINGTGNTLNNTITGNSAANTLSGGTGADTMIGGAGDDTYVVDNTSDVVTELASEGSDLVQSSVTYTLSANVENLTLTGTTAINGTGNTLDNVLTGNTVANTLTGGAGNDTLNGGTGADTMIGGTGNDTYVVDNTSDVITELTSEGTDLVQSSVTYTLSTNVENLTLTGTTAINGTGNALDNILIGNSANNTLTGGDGNDTIDGGTGTDTMVGGLGDDTYVVNVSTDVVTEAASAGNDTIQSAVTLTLTTNVENLVLTGTTAINGTGNTLNNLLRGNTAINTLNGGTGNDILEGGDGNDILTDTSGTALFNGGVGADTITGGASAEIFLGGLGNDTYTTAGGNDIILFNKGDGQDTFATGGTGSDTLSLGGSSLAYADLVFTKSTNDLVLKVGTSDQITFKNWYAATPSKPVTRLQVMAEAMAGFVQGGSNPLMDQKVENFNFTSLVGAFDAARAANTSLTSWALTNALSSFQLAGSDTAAMGGDLAYQYGKNGTLAGIGVTPVLSTLSDANLGTNPQALNSLASLQTGTVRLS